MPSLLSQYFPNIRTRNEVLTDIQSNKSFKKTFEGWSEERQEWFLDICTGNRGVNMLSDTFFKEIMNPETAPDRLEELLSVLIGEKVKIKEVLPLGSDRLADEASLIIMDIVVEFEDGSIADIEAQRVGYRFLGARSACYSSDMLLRQYKRLRSKNKTGFNYNSVHPVYTIVFYEKSPKAFNKYPDTYVHKFEQSSDTGLELDLLQKYIFVPLDIFLKCHQNKCIENLQDAWFTFLGANDPDAIVRLINTYPEFKKMYEEVYAMCENIEDIMSHFSEELFIMDRNTQLLMIDEMQDEIESQKQELQSKAQELQSKDQELHSKVQELHSKDQELHSKDQELHSKDQELRSKAQELQSKAQELHSKAQELQNAREEIARLQALVADKCL